MVLDFIAQHEMALPPLAIWGGINREYRVTFSYRTMQNILSDLVESGDLFKVDPEILREEAEIREVPNPSGRRSYYFITEKGRERIRNV